MLQLSGVVPCETMHLGAGLFIGLEPAMGTLSSASKPSAWGLFAAEGCECVGLQPLHSLPGSVAC